MGHDSSFSDNFLEINKRLFSNLVKCATYAEPGFSSNVVYLLLSNINLCIQQIIPYSGKMCATCVVVKCCIFCFITSIHSNPLFRDNYSYDICQLGCYAISLSCSNWYNQLRKCWQVCLWTLKSKLCLYCALVQFQNCIIYRVMPLSSLPRHKTILRIRWCLYWSLVSFVVWMLMDQDFAINQG